MLIKQSKGVRSLKMDGCKNLLIWLILVIALSYGRGQLSGPDYCTVHKLIPCDNGGCIRREKWCDGDFDCSDRSDEKYCKTPPWYSLATQNNNCDPVGHFTCNNARCVPAVVKCDYIDDCGDYSDEDICDDPSTIYPSNYESEASTSFNGVVTEHPDTTPIPVYTERMDIQPARVDITPRNYDQVQPDRNTRDQTYSHRTTEYSTYDYNRKYPDANNRNRASDTVPSGSYPSYENSYTTRRTPTRAPSSPRRSDPGYSTGYDGSRNSRNPSVQRTPFSVVPPRSVAYQPASRPSYNDVRKTVRKPPFSRFYFSKNYTSQFRSIYRSHINQAKDWILGQRDDSLTWGKDTPRALIALSLISNSFTSDVTENDLMKRSLQTHFGIKLLRNNTGTEKMSPTRLAMYIHALLATCQDPRDFLGIDLTDILEARKEGLVQTGRFVNPLIYLALCLTDHDLTRNDFQKLQMMLVSRFPTAVTKDIHILATTVLACLDHRYPKNRGLTDNLDEAFRNLLSQKLNDDSYGNVYTTALAAQVFMSTNTSRSGDLENTLDYIASQQNDDGSFGDMQATYYSLLALSGRSLLHLRNTKCDPIPTDEISEDEDCVAKKTVFYTLRVGLPETFSASQQVTVCEDANVLKIMREAARHDLRFKFGYKDSQGHIEVHTIANAANDAERGLFWNLYILQANSQLNLSDRDKRDVKDIIPRNNDEVLFWYLPVS